MVWTKAAVAYLGLTSILLFTTVANVSAQEFLSVSIDCGVSRPYTDGIKIPWEPDGAYISSGENIEFSSNQRDVLTARVFPEGRSKNCYVLPVKNETTYLLRAKFYPGDATVFATEIDFPVSFSVFVNSNEWLTFTKDVNDTRLSWLYEAIFRAEDLNEVYVCLVKGDVGLPFINSLELRELPSTSYSPVKSSKKFFQLVDRLNLGTSDQANPVLRYPEDSYDRYWWSTPPSQSSYAGMERVENSDLPPIRFQSAVEGYNWPPYDVLKDAWVGDVNLSYILFGPVELYAAFYVKEIRPEVNTTVLASDPVGMNLTVGPIRLLYNITRLQSPVDPVFFPIEIDSSLFSLEITVRTQRWSLFPSIVNGFELLWANDVNDSATHLGDHNAMKAIKLSFDLEDWTGDPCFPVPWDWLTCNFKTFRITKLKLSKMNISGTLPEELGDLTELTEIHLDNNNLTGTIPESLTSLSKLKVLALDNNNLSGEIPSGLRLTTGFTFEGNVDLCPLEDKPCKSSPPTSLPAPPPAGASRTRLDFGFEILALLSMMLLYPFP